MIKVLIAEDHALVREGLRNILEKSAGFVVVGEATNGLEALTRAEDLSPDVLLLDLTLPRMHGLDVLARLQKRRRIKSVVVSMHGDAPSVLESLRLGARGYVLKDSPAAQLIEGIKAVHHGGSYVSPPLQPMLKKAAVSRLNSHSPEEAGALSGRERLVLQKVGAGLSSEEIGRELGISAATVGKHRCNIGKKIGSRNQTDLVRYAIRHKLIET